MILLSDQFALRGLDAMLIVYSLYDLTSERIHIVENSV